ncbi:hypothetical protein CRENBAI_025151 [Crenichthys baileyi]|uniref:Uncharacterized protein n=1 Tax=Crenichthys baileyi TaxID=28760 RepID=A0AAV9S928_9TELE
MGQSVREGHGQCQCIWMGIARENVTHIYPSRSGVRGPADATGGSFFSVRGPNDISEARPPGRCFAHDLVLGQLSPHGRVARTSPIATSPPTPLYPAPTSHDAPLTESQI